MGNVSKIPIKNIYYMLCYAWNTLEQKDNSLVGSEKFDNIYNLLARVYINGVENLIRRDLSGYYIQEKEMLATVKGKVIISDSLKEQSFRYGKLVCEYDAYSTNFKLNQIIKTTINILVNAPDINKGLRKELLKLRFYFADIQEIQLSKALFSSLKYNRNNVHYRTLTNVSQMIYFGLITKEAGGKVSFADFSRDEHMAKLYEKFVLNFYRTHLDKGIYNVHAPKLKWDLDEEVDAESLSLLPEMRTDIVVENKKQNTQLIIDTKFYARTLVASNWTDTEKVRTAHLYQIFAYVNNSNFSGDIKGMLLYPTIQKEVNAKFPIGGNSISINTLNLNEEWKEISDRLLSLVR